MPTSAPIRLPVTRYCLVLLLGIMPLWAGAGQIGRGVWTEVVGLPAGRENSPCAELAGCLYVMGGESAIGGAGRTNVYRYNGTNWSEVVGLPAPRKCLVAGAFNSAIYAIGGGEPGVAETNVYRYDGTTWQEVVGLPAGANGGSVAIWNNALYVLGGWSGSSKSNVYRFSGTNWTQEVGLPVPLYETGAGIVDGMIHVVGGLITSAERTNMYRYNGTNWTEVVGLPAARRALAGRAWNGALYAAGGGTIDGSWSIHTNVFRYDGTTWSEVEALPVPRGYHALGTLNDRMYVIGGVDASVSSAQTNVYRYDYDGGVTPSSGPVTGGFTVTISGTNLCNGLLADVTNVTMCGVSVSSVDSVAGSTQIVVTAAAGSAGTGDVKVYAASCGTSVKLNGFTYLESPEIQAAGGTLTNYTLDGTNFTAHVFTEVGTTNLVVFGGPLVCDVLVVAGGGGGGSRYAGGGGAGGIVYTSICYVSNGSIAVTVGDGGVGASQTPYGAPGSNGFNSVFGALVAIGGGGGGSPDDSGFSCNGSNGGSGGGAARRLASVGVGVLGQGHNGGLGYAHHQDGGTNGYQGGGGGGAWGAGGTATNFTAGNGGSGITYSISGSLVAYGGGGGGGATLGLGEAAEGGMGGGGDGGAGVIGSNGVANTGGGGGGGGGDGTNVSPWIGQGGGRGGSGIVIVRYPAFAAPLIAVQPQSQTVNAGSPVTFTVGAWGSAPLLYQWQKNGTNIGGATATNYTLASVEAADAGGYRCVVSNALGAVTSAVATLTLNESPEIQAAGGTLTNYTLDGTNFTAHVFTEVGTTNLVVFGGPLVCDVLVVAGGGGGGSRYAGGGGAGGIVYTSICYVSNGSIAVTVGDGGVGASQTPYGAPGSNGFNSVFGALVAIGGGGGGSPDDSGFSCNGSNGGSGGGAARRLASVGVGVLGQGHNGGLGYAHHQDGGTNGYQGGGGGGAWGAGGTATNFTAGNGGSGITYSISGSLVAYGGGGGGGATLGLGEAAEGGMGGGGDGGAGVIGSNGVANTGGGGGGGGGDGTNVSPWIGQGGGRGGSGIVIVRYPAFTAPVITVQPQSQTVNAGSPVTFTVDAWGTAPLLYQWQKNGTNIGGATATNYTLASVEAADAGGYRCVVSNALGAVTSAVATLTVNGGQIGYLRWTEVAGLPAGRLGFAVAELNGALYAVGGATALGSSGTTNVFRYDGTNWSQVEGIPAERGNLAGEVFNGALYAIGGATPGVAKTNVYRYDGMNWAEVAGLPSPRSSLKAAVLGDSLYVVGGWNSSVFRTNVYRYNGTNWSEVAGLPAAVDDYGIGVMGGELYVVGGAVPGASKTNVYRYNGTSWAEIIGLPSMRDGLGAGELGGKLYAVGGSDGTTGGSTVHTNMYCYDGAQWGEVKGLPQPRIYLSTAVMKESLYALGGTASGTVPSSAQTNVYRYDYDGGVTPSSGPVTGGFAVTISGTNLCNGLLADVTNVTMCGVSVSSVDSVAGSTQIVVTAAEGVAGVGDVKVYSASCGMTAKADGFTYLDSESPAITAQPQSLVRNSGQSAAFWIQASGTAPLFYQWQKNGADIGGATATNYTLAAVEAADAGGYRCVVSNVSGGVTSAVATLTVNEPPAITVQPQSLTRNVGQSAMFQMAASGTAPLLYQWQKDGTNIGGATATNYTLESVEAADAGGYRCVVSNAAGSATSAVAVLTVNSPPPAPNGLSASDGAYTGKVALAWNASIGALGYQVFRNTSDYSDGAAQIATTVAAACDDAGAVPGTTYYYWVKATNAAGMSAFSASDSGWRRAVFTITATAGAGGSVTPSGAVPVVQGASLTFTILPASGNYVSGLQVDGAPVTAASAYTFTDVSANHTLMAAFGANQPPSIGLAAGPLSGVAPLRVLFDFTGSSDPDGTIAKYEVDRTGDGIYEVQSTEAGIGFYLTYAAAGTYQSVARVTDNCNAIGTTSVTIQVHGVSPVAVIEALPASGTAPLAVSFSGTNSTAPLCRGLVAYEWDFDGDGVYDRLTLDGLAAWTYREAGTNPATLRVTDDTGMKAESSVSVIVAPSPLPPPSVELSANPDAGYLPLGVTFDAQLAGGHSSSNFQWDFDGDGTFDERTATGACGHVYTVAGTYPARVMVTDANGLTGSGAVTVRVNQATSLKAWITTPNDGSRVSGAEVSLRGHAAPASRAASAQFQFKPVASNDWVNIGGVIVPPPHAYGQTWDVTGLPPASYHLRLAVADTLGDTVYSDTLQVIVAASSRKGAEAAVGDIEEGEEDGRHTKNETFSRDASAAAIVYDGTEVLLPMGAVEGGVSVRVVLAAQNAYPTNGAAFGRTCIQANRVVGLAGEALLQKPAVVTIPYRDDDNDGLVDGTRVKVSTLMMYWFDPVTASWKLCLETGIYPQEKLIKGKAYCLAEFGVFGGLREAPVYGDFDGDRKSDPALYQASSGLWRVMLSASGYRETQLGLGGRDWQPVPADYDADQKADPGIYRDQDGYWYGYLSGRGYAHDDAWVGGPGCRFVPSDYDGDGKSDPAVYHESSGLWAVLMSATGYQTVMALFGGPGYSAIPADFDGDNRTDVAVYHEASGIWYVMASGSGYATLRVALGGPGWIPAHADYDGDGRTDPGVYHAESGQWLIWLSNSGYLPAGVVLGGPGCSPVPGDYDGAGRVSPAVYRELSGEWQVLMSGSGYAPAGAVFGGQDFVPVTSGR